MNKNKQTKILVDMHFVVYSNFNSLDLVSSRIKLTGVKTVYEAENRK